MTDNIEKDDNLIQLANCIRFLSIDAVQKANSGHPGMPMGMADIATVLFKYHLKFDPKNPKWIDRDRFVVSNGHGSMLLYSCLYLSGYEDITIEDIKNFRQLNSPTAGHPEYKDLNGIETRPFFWPLHLQKALPEKFKPNNNFPVSENIGKNGLYLPLGKKINKSKIKFISYKLIESIKKIK